NEAIKERSPSISEGKELVRLPREVGGDAAGGMAIPGIPGMPSCAITTAMRVKMAKQAAHVATETPKAIALMPYK
ncbi:unnamed protein product, partial [Ilex paraguariensis]